MLPSWHTPRDLEAVQELRCHLRWSSKSIRCPICPKFLLNVLITLFLTILFPFYVSFHRLAAARNDLGEEDLEAQLEEFMQRQAELESGDAKRKAEPGQVLGAAEVSEDEAKKYCREIVNVLKLLKNKRDMSVNEVKLTIAIEDPRSRERRLMGMEDSSGVSRDEMADALDAVAEGNVPADRIALRELHREMVNWPFVDADEPGTTGKN
jgi:hypothetical protein